MIVNLNESMRNAPEFLSLKQELIVFEQAFKRS